MYYIPPYITMVHGTIFPAAPIERQLFYRDDLHVWYIYNGTTWVSLTVGGGGAGDYIDLLEIIPPANPPADTLRLYVEDFKGFPFFSFRDSTGMIRKIVRDSVFVGRNMTGAPIPIGRAVYASGSSGNVPTLALARANALATMPAIGITVEAIADNAFGRVMQIGLLENVDTSAFAVGNVLYVSAVTAGLLTAAAPLYPNIRQEMGTVLVSGVGNGAMQCIARSMMNEGILDHGGLLGLADDDHPQYALDTDLHNRLHSIISPLDHSSAATSGKMLKADANGLPIEATNTDAGVASAVSLKHTQGTDVALGAVGTKNPPIDADKPLYRDSMAGDALVTSTWTQTKAFLKTYFDTLYAALAHKTRHQSGGADQIAVTYDLTDRFFLPSLIAFKLGRFLYEQFNTYDMIQSWVAGTGSVGQAYFLPTVSTGKTSGGSAVQNQNSPLMYMDGATENFFFVVGYLQGITDCTAFIGLALNTWQVFTVNEVSKHVGLIFYISGATATVYASNADGVTQTKTDLGLNPNTYRNWVIKSDNGHIYFYSGSTLVATHTTNFPSGLMRWKESIISAVNGNVTLTSRGFTFAAQ